MLIPKTILTKYVGFTHNVTKGKNWDSGFSCVIKLLSDKWYRFDKRFVFECTPIDKGETRTYYLPNEVKCLIEQLEEYYKESS